MSHPLRLRLNWLQTDSGNDFPENGGVWLLLQIRSNWKAFPVDWIWEPKQRKWFSVSIFTSKYFRPWKIEERKRERGRKKESIATSPSVDITGWRKSANRDLCFDLRVMRRSLRDCNQCIAPPTSPACAVVPIAISSSIFARSRSWSTHRANASIVIANASIAITIARSADHSDHDRNLSNRDRDLSDRDLAFVCPDFMIFFLGFVCVLRDKWYYIIVW